jgi:hypothetical protein
MCGLGLEGGEADRKVQPAQTLIEVAIGSVG